MTLSPLYKTNIDGNTRLTNDEALAKLKSYRETGSRRDLDAVLYAHYGLALHFVKKYKRGAPPHVAEEDLVQEALEGLWIGIERYQPERGVLIATYVSWWIRSCLSKYAVSAYRVTTPARQTRQLFWSARKRKAEREALGLDTSPATMAPVLGVRLETYESAISWLSTREVSCSAALYEDGGETVGDRLPSPDPCHVDILGDRDLIAKVDDVARAYAEPLKPFSRDVFAGRVWTHADVMPTLDEIGRRHGRTRERARQVERLVRDGFRKAVSKAGLLDAVAGLVQE